MGEPPESPARKRRRPALKALLEAAQKAGKPVRSAIVDADGRVVLEFGEPTADTNTNEWDEALNRGKH
jgi:hypothetical protein